MTNIEKLEEVIKETFPDLFNATGIKVKDTSRLRFCDIVCCGVIPCAECPLNERRYDYQEYQGPLVSNNTKEAVTSGDISW